MLNDKRTKGARFQTLDALQPAFGTWHLLPFQRQSRLVIQIFMEHNISMLPMWIEFFEDLEFVRGRSKNTVLSYRRDLELYEDFKKST